MASTRDEVRAELNKVYTSIPCIVVAVKNDFTEQLVDVQPTIDILLQDGTTQRRPVIYNVPVMQYSSGNAAITLPIQVGDQVACWFCMRALEMWREGNGRPTPPDNYAKFHIKDAFALPGLFPRKLAINNPDKRSLPHSTADVVIAANIGTEDESEIRIKPSGKIEINCKQADVNATESASIITHSLSVSADNTTWVGDIDLTGNINQTGSQMVSGDVVASGKSLASHNHDVAGIQTGGFTVTSGAPN